MPLDIAIRRLIITRSDLQRLRAYLSRRGGDEARTQQMQALFSARGRSRDTTGYGAGLRFRAKPGAGGDDAPESPPAPAPPPEPRPRSSREPSFEINDIEVVNLGDRLLRSRKRRADDEE